MARRYIESAFKPEGGETVRSAMVDGYCGHLGEAMLPPKDVKKHIEGKVNTPKDKRTTLILLQQGGWKCAQCEEVLPGTASKRPGHICKS